MSAKIPGTPRRVPSQQEDVNRFQDEVHAWTRELQAALNTLRKDIQAVRDSIPDSTSLTDKVTQLENTLTATGVGAGGAAPRVVYVNVTTSLAGNVDVVVGYPDGFCDVTLPPLSSASVAKVLNVKVIQGVVYLYGDGSDTIDGNSQQKVSAPNNIKLYVITNPVTGVKGWVIL